LKHQHDFEYLFMNTKGGHRGLELICRNCRRSCTLQWDRQTPAEAADAIRKKWLSFLCHPILFSSDRKEVCQRLYFNQIKTNSDWAPNA
jgi:hypothetical protein